MREETQVSLSASVARVCAFLRRAQTERGCHVRLTHHQVARMESLRECVCVCVRAGRVGTE